MSHALARPSFTNARALSKHAFSTRRARLSSSTIMSAANIQRLKGDDPRMSQIVIHNGVCYLSGQVGLTTTTVEEQTKETLDKCEALLLEAGTSKENLLTCMVWLKDISDAPAFNSVYNAWVEGAKPTRACVQAPLARESLLVEVQFTAAMP